jgi:hypothetical protein
MSLRSPIVAGVAGGVGTTLLATALGGPDGRALDGELAVPGDAVDVLVCRSTLPSLGLLHHQLATTPTPPVVAVVADIPARVPRAVVARIRMAAPHAFTFVAIPYVGSWRELDDPYREAAHVLAHPTRELPKHLHDFAASMRNLAAAVGELLIQSGEQDPLPARTYATATWLDSSAPAPAPACPPPPAREEALSIPVAVPGPSYPSLFPDASEPAPTRSLVSRLRRP